MSLGTIKFSEASLFELSDIDTSVIRYDEEGVMVLSDSVVVREHIQTLKLKRYKAPQTAIDRIFYHMLET